MKTFLIYQLEAACCLALFYLFYTLLLKKSQGLHLKRSYIIATSLLAFVIPALDFHYHSTVIEPAMALRPSRRSQIK